MPFKGVDIMDVKKEFVLRAMDVNVVFTELCREFGISTKCGYKWRKRFVEEGYAGLKEQSRRPKSNSQSMPEPVSVELLRIKKLHPTWGAKKILAVYKRNNNGKYTPVRSTVERLFVRAGYTGVRKRRKVDTRIIIQHRIVPEKPNDVWTVDFKGWWYSKNKEKINPLTVRDEYSKSVLALDAVEKGDITSVKAVFIRLFKEFGLPLYIRSDNGPPFANVLNYWGLTKLSVWWMTLGIRLDRIDPGCPHQNGGHERMHRDIKKELQGKIDGTLGEHQTVFNEWLNIFNTIRPHEALGMKVPADVYVKSPRKYSMEHVELVYGKGFKTRYVNDRGYINYDSRRVFIGNPFSGYHVGIKEFVDKPLEVWFNNIMLGVINSENCLIEPEFNNIKVVFKSSHVLPMS
jgi:transposase InsO family protein